MKSNLFHLFAWAVLVLGVALEAQIMEPEETTQREVCEGCERPAILWKTEAGWLCENCDLENLERKQKA